jgi:hypothetical protein
MITAITEVQKSQIPGWVDKYTQVGLSTAPADRPRAERGIVAHYEAAKLAPPKAIVWSGSPIVTALAAPACAVLVENVKGDVREHVPAFVERFVTNEALRPEVTRVIREVLTAVALVGDDGEEALQRLNPASAVRNAWSRYSGGAWWCSFTAWATFIRDVLGVEDIPVGPREDVDSSCGWWWAHHEFTIATERPCILTRDVQGRLHGETGPAISWPDGWSLHYWRGTKVPRAWIENPSELDPRVALEHENIELRRCAAEIIGWQKVLDLLQPTTIDADVDPQIGVLLEVNLEGVPSRFLKVLCGTGRTFVLPVPAEMTTARAANAWTFGLQPAELQLEVRT